MKKGLVMVLAVTFLAVASTASAQVFGQGKTQFSFGLTQFVGHTIDTLGYDYKGHGTINDHHLLGILGSFKYGITQNWAVDVAGFWGFGSDKGEFGADEIKLSYQAFGVRLGLDRTENIGDVFGVYFGPGIECVSARSKVKDNSFVPGVNDDNPRTSTLSLDGRIGVQHKLGSNFGLKANVGQKWSYSSGSFDTDLGGPALEEVKVSRWVSSMNGFAGFVIYVN